MNVHFIFKTDSHCARNSFGNVCMHVSINNTGTHWPHYAQVDDNKRAIKRARKGYFNFLSIAQTKMGPCGKSRISTCYIYKITTLKSSHSVKTVTFFSGKSEKKFKANKPLKLRIYPFIHVIKLFMR